LELLRSQQVTKVGGISGDENVAACDCLRGDQYISITLPRFESRNELRSYG
jgi:hypothetical protein